MISCQLCSDEEMFSVVDHGVDGFELMLDHMVKKHSDIDLSTIPDDMIIHAHAWDEPKRRSDQKEFHDARRQG